MGDELRYSVSGLEKKAHVCETPRPSGPGDASPPDNLPATFAAYSQLMASVTRMEKTLEAGDVEGKRIAGAIRAAAGAYQKIDEQKKAALDRQMRGGESAPQFSEPVAPDMSGIPGSLTIPSIEYPSADGDAGYMSWKKAVQTIYSGDTQALSIKYLRDQWRAYKSTIQGHGNNFAQPAEGWSGPAAETCAEAMRSLASWWTDMGEECNRLAQEAETFADAHDKLIAEHPTQADLEWFESACWASPADRNKAFRKYQEQSEEALAAYANGTRLMEIRPGKPPAIGGLPAVHEGEVAPSSDPNAPGGPGSGSPGGGGGGAGGGGGTPEMPELPSIDPSMSPMSANSAGEEQSSGSPSSGGSSSGGSPSGGSPSGGGAPSGAGMPDGGLPSDMPGGSDIPGLDDPSLKPASAGGGGGGGVGGGGGGMPAAPLGPAVGADSVSPSPSSTRGGGVGVPGGPGGGAGGMMGGGMGGMGAGHGQGQGKEKKRDPKLAPDEDLYTEDRAHTEGVIGHRPRREKDSGKQQ